MPTYKSSNSVNRSDFVEAGDYMVRIVDAQESISQQGNEMIILLLCVEPGEALVNDYLVFTENAYWKIDIFRAAIGEKVTVEVVPKVRTREYRLKLSGC